jgi:hypothetical protein
MTDKKTIVIGLLLVFLLPLLLGLGMAIMLWLSR